MPSDPAQPYTSYLLRVWRIQKQGRTICRALLEATSPRASGSDSKTWPTWRPFWSPKWWQQVRRMRRLAAPGARVDEKHTDSDEQEEMMNWKCSLTMASLSRQPIRCPG